MGCSNFVLLRISFAFLTFSGNKVLSAGTNVFVTTIVEVFVTRFLLITLSFANGMMLVYFGDTGPVISDYAGPVKTRDTGPLSIVQY